MDEAEARISSSVEDPTLREVSSAADVAAALAALPVESRRALISRLLTVELLPVGSGHRTFDPGKSLRITWR